MKLSAREVPYSTVVGGGLMLLDEEGQAIFQVNFMGTSRGISRQQTQELTRQFKWFVDEVGLEVTP